ncbi:MAG: peptidoglycan-associated lipoprotein Pal [Paracoccaceae bacterium]
MNIFLKSAAILAILATGACSDQGGLFGGGDGNGNGVNGAGIGTVEQTSLAYFQQTIGDTVLFEVDQSTLAGGAISILNQQAQWLNANPVAHILIEGHADEQGTREYNIALGSKRASSVRDYLVSQGVADARISVVSFGKERPLAICSSESCWSKNRRAVTIVKNAGGV